MRTQCTAQILLYCLYFIEETLPARHDCLFGSTKYNSDFDSEDKSDLSVRLGLATDCSRGNQAFVPSGTLAYARLDKGGRRIDLSSTKEGAGAQSSS